MVTLEVMGTGSTPAMSAVARVRALSTTPVKGFGLGARDRVFVGPHGVTENRRFFLIDERGRMLNGKQIGALSSVAASWDEESGELVMTLPGGEVVAGTVVLGEELPVRFYSRETLARLVVGPWAEVLSPHSGRDLRLVMGAPGDTAVDRGIAGAVSLVSRASIERLERLAGRDVDPRRFRMLVEVAGVEAHGEDRWVGQRVRIGDALVLLHGHVGRCLVTGQDPDTGVPDMPTLELLRSYRHGLDTTEPLAFGVYGEVLEPGAVRLGDPVTVDGGEPAERYGPEG